MAKPFEYIRFIAGAFALAVIVDRCDAGIGAAAGSVNPTASSVNEQKLLSELGRVQGRGTIPDVRSYVIGAAGGTRVAPFP